MKIPNRMKTPAFGVLCLATLGVLFYTGSLFGAVGFLLIFALPYLLKT